MSAGNAEPASVSSRSELERILSSLEDRIDELESDLARERARRRELEQRVGKQEDRYGLILDDILALEDAVDDLSGPTGDMLPSEKALPIMRLTWSFEATPEALSSNERRAAIVWKHFFEVCAKTPTKYVLDSNDVGTVLAADEGSAPYRQTVRRVMDRVADLGKEYIDLQKVDGRNALVIDRVEFERLAEELASENQD